MIKKICLIVPLLCLIIIMKYFSESRTMEHAGILPPGEGGGYLIIYK